MLHASVRSRNWKSKCRAQGPSKPWWLHSLASFVFPSPMLKQTRWGTGSQELGPAPCAAAGAILEQPRYTSSEGFNIFRRIRQSKCPLEHLWAVTTIIYACRCHAKTNEALLVSERLQNPQNLKVPPSLLVLPSSYLATTSFAYSIPFYYFFFYWKMVQVVFT